MGAKKIVDNWAVSSASAVLHRRRTVVCAYHGVDDPDRFEQQLRWLLRSRRPLDLATFEDMVLFGRAPEEPSFLVTFDDGRRSVLERGLPVLERLGVPAALFVVSGLVGTADPFWWDEVEALSGAGGRTSVATQTGVPLVRALKEVPDHRRRQALDELRASSGRAAPDYPHLDADELRHLHRSGVAIASHSATHPCLDRCTPEEVLEELARSRADLEGVLGAPVRSLAYPNGNLDEMVIEQARRAGYTVGFAFDHQLTPAVPPSTMTVSRVRVDTCDDLPYFASVCSGARPAIHRWRGLP